MKHWNSCAQRILHSTLIAIGLAVITVGQAHAGVPDPSHSICPTAVVMGATGSCCFDVIVRDFAGNPVAGSTVHVDFGTCVVSFCPAQPPGVTIVGNGVNVITDATGRAHICICATFTPPCNASIFADAVPLCTLPMQDCSATPTHKSSWGQLKIIYR